MDKSCIGKAVEINDTDHYCVHDFGRIYSFDTKSVEEQPVYRVKYKNVDFQGSLFFEHEVRFLSEEEEALAVLAGLL